MMQRIRTHNKASNLYVYDSVVRNPKTPDELDEYHDCQPEHQVGGTWSAVPAQEWTPPDSNQPKRFITIAQYTMRQES